MFVIVGSLAYYFTVLALEIIAQTCPNRCCFNIEQYLGDGYVQRKKNKRKERKSTKATKAKTTKGLTQIELRSLEYRINENNSKDNDTTQIEMTNVNPMKHVTRLNAAAATTFPAFGGGGAKAASVETKTESSKIESKTMDNSTKSPTTSHAVAATAGTTTIEQTKKQMMLQKTQLAKKLGHGGRSKQKPTKLAHDKTDETNAKWSTHRDPKSGNDYFVNDDTNRTTWTNHKKDQVEV